MNEKYQTPTIPEFYATHRISWTEIYPSEKKIIESLGLTNSSRVVDMGCACGGLGLALQERFAIKAYTGVDLNRVAIDVAGRLCPWGDFHAGDFLEIETKLPQDYDAGFSLSCADWDGPTEELLAALFRRIRPGGALVLSCRLTNQNVNGTHVQARQAIVFGSSDGSNAAEYAPYKVYRLNAMLDVMQRLGVAWPIKKIRGYGYWGNVPPSVKGLPFEKVFYAVFAVEKAAVAQVEGLIPRLELDVSADLLR